MRDWEVKSLLAKDDLTRKCKILQTVYYRNLIMEKTYVKVLVFRINLC